MDSESNLRVKLEGTLKISEKAEDPSEKIRHWQLNKKGVLDRSRYAWEHSILSDCSFRVGKDVDTKLFQCHKVILAWASPVFQAMFFGGVAEKDGPIIVPDVVPDAFSAMLEYIYTDNLNLKSFDLGCDLLYTAKKYILPVVSEKCKNYMMNNLTHTNVCRAYEFAKLLEEPEVEEKCLKIMREKTERVVQDQSFMDISQSTLVKLLEQDFLMVVSELELIDASLRWAKGEAEHKGIFEVNGTVLRQMLGPAFQLLRFLSLTPAQFASGPALSDFLSQEESFAILVNLSSPGSLKVSGEICKLTKRRCCPHNDIWNPSCNKVCLRRPLFKNCKIIESLVTFTATEDIKLIGMQLPTQVYDEEFTNDMYKELYVVSLLGPNKSLLSYVQFDETVSYNSFVNVKFDGPVDIKKLEPYILKVWLHCRGEYPKCPLENSVKVGTVLFEFNDSTPEYDIIQSLEFIPSYCASDAYTFQGPFGSGVGVPISRVGRKFNFSGRKTGSMSSASQ